MRFKRVPAKLSSKIQHFYKYLHGSSQATADVEFLYDLPPMLQMQLSLALFARVFIKVPLFTDCSNRCVLCLCWKLKPMVFVPKEVVVAQGSPGQAPFLVSR